MSDVQLLAGIITDLVLAICDMSIWLFLLKPKCKTYIVCIIEFAISMICSILMLVNNSGDSGAIQVIFWVINLMTYVCILTLSQGGKIKSLVKYEIFGSIYSFVYLVLITIITKTSITSSVEDVVDVETLVIFVIAKSLIVIVATAAGYLISSWMLTEKERDGSVVKYSLCLVNIYVILLILVAKMDRIEEIARTNFVYVAMFVIVLLVIEFILVKVIFVVFDSIYLRKCKKVLHNTVEKHYEYFRGLKIIDHKENDTVETININDVDSKTPIDYEVCMPMDYKAVRCFETTGFKAIDSLLLDIDTYCAQYHIVLDVISCDISTYNVDEKDLLVVLGHILYSMLMVNKQVETDRYIKVRIKEVANNLLIIMEASKSGTCNPFKKGLYDMEGKCKQKYVKLINDVVQEYGGIIEKISEENYYTISVMIPVKSKE